MGDFYHKKIVLVVLIHLVFKNSVADDRYIVKFPDVVENFENAEFITKKLEERKSDPIVLLIEDQPEAFISANYFVDKVLTESSDDLDFWIINFNSTGVSSVLTSSRDNIEKFKATLNNLTSESYLHQDILNSSLPFFGTLHAAQILPKNGTIVIFSQAKMVDKNLAQLAFNAIFTKNITVHLYWDILNSYPNQLLKEISRHSGGQIFSLKKYGSPFENYKRENKINSGISMLLTRKNQKQTNHLHFLIDSDVIGIYVSIQPWEDTTVTLTSPTGYFMTFSPDDTKDAAKKYSFGSFSEHQDDFLDIHLNFLNSVRPTVGEWNLKIDNPTTFYNLTVYGLTNITTHAIIEENVIPNESPKEIIKIGVKGDVDSISDVILFQSDGVSIITNATYKDNQKQLALRNKDEASLTDFDVEILNKPNIKSAYALVKGLDSKGNAFERLSNIFGFRRNDYPQTLKLEVGIGSQTLITPGEQAQIYFEVTNRGNDAINVFFSAADTRWILQSLSAYRRVLNPQESHIVTLTLTRQARSGTYQDEITFTAKGGGQIVQKKVMIDVGATQNHYDRSEPYLDHTYTSDCTEVIFKRCEQGTWTIEVTAQDTDSGLLQVGSIPKGLYFPSEYTAGTLDRVVGYYSDSCCNPDLQIIAVDRANNRRSYNVNAYHAIWSPGAIAALVLGILLFILLIALIVYLICRWRKQKETYDLPTYRGGDI